MVQTRHHWPRKAGLLLAFAALSACTHLGPRSVTADRFDYSSAIAESWKQQILLNIVKIRYVDLPVFVDVSSVVAGYSLQTGVTMSGVLSSEGAVQGNYGSIAGQGIYTDRPTVTYVPMTGEKFLRGLITPIDPRSIFFMLQAGYPADFVLGLTVESLNGLRNRTAAGGRLQEADPGFLRALQLIRELQVDGSIGMRVVEDKSKAMTTVLMFRSDDISAEITAKSAELRRLLRLPEGEYQFLLSYSPMRAGASELTVNSRSMLQILQAFASYVEVPVTHLGEQRAPPAFEHIASEQRDIGRIRSGTSKPAETYAAVQYRGYWFWVDDGDWRTKRAMTAVMFFFTLADTGNVERLPLITIPAQ
jgi:hypothetical protein